MLHAYSRPETEELVGHVLDHFKSMVPVPDRSHLNVLEVGCGSGAICLSLLKETSQPIRYSGPIKTQVIRSD